MSPSRVLAYLFFFSFWLFFWVYPSFVQAEVEVPSRNAYLFFTQGLAAFNEEKYEDAADSFQKAVKEDFKDTEANYYLGITLARLKIYDEAVFAFERVLILEPTHHRARFELGMVYFILQSFEDAKKAFQKIMTEYPESEEAQSSKKFIDEIKKRKKALVKEWSAGLSLGYQYDTNVTLKPTDDSLVTGITNKEDSRLIILGNLGYDKKITDRFNLGVGYKFYQNLHKEITELNVQSHTLEVKTGYKFKLFTFHLPYRFNYILLDQNKYEQIHAVNPTISFPFRKRFLARVEYEFEDKEFFTSATRDATNHEIGLGLYYFFSQGKRFLRLQYYHDWEDAAGPDWDYQGNRVKGTFYSPLPYKINLMVDVEYDSYGFENINSILGIKRDDDVYKAGVTFFREFTHGINAVFQYLFTRNRSNIVYYDYSRHIISLMVGYRF